MSQLVGLHSGLDQSRKTSLLPPELTLAASAEFKPVGSDYVQQSVQLLDELGNGASFVRIANGGYRTSYRVINVDVSDNALHKVRLVNNVAGGVLTYGKVTGVTVPTGFLKICDDRTDDTSLFVLGPGSSMSIPPGLHRLSFEASGAGADAVVSIVYGMETYMANIVFNGLPSVGDTISSSKYCIFEFCEEGDTASVITPNIAVEIPDSGLVVDLCTNFNTAFNTAYVNAIEPVSSKAAYHWSRTLEADDLVYYKNAGHWLATTNLGVQINSIDAALVRGLSANVSTTTSVQIFKHL